MYFSRFVIFCQLNSKPTFYLLGENDENEKMISLFISQPQGVGSILIKEG